MQKSNTSSQKRMKVMKQFGRFIAAFTIFALYTSFSPSDGTIEDPSIAYKSNTQTEVIA